MHHVRLSILSALALVALAVTGCQTEPTVNRVQPNVVEKSIFAADGEWYYQQTVIDTPYGAGYTFVGEQGDLEKIEWEIQESFLIARRSYEYIAGSEAGGISGAPEANAAVAMYAIESHFDIRREYNPTTGEEVNIVSENTSDRPWHQRRYMRVDWSKNLITDHSFLVLARLFDGIRTEPVSYYVQDLDANHPHAPKFVRADEADEDSAVTYVDIVNKMFVEPSSVYIDGYGDLPSCFLLGTSHLDCAPGEITVRNSFLKVDPQRDYQPFLYTGDRMERFGYFVSERAGFDPHYGVVESERFRFANRHNLWAESHQRDANGDLVRCSADAECADGRGSFCDIDYARAHREVRDDRWLGACTIPYRDRAVRPIAYHLSVGFPADLEPDARHFTDEWNRAFVGTVGSLRANECLAHGGDAASCDAERARADAAQMYVLCHNPVVEGDSEACGPAGTSAQIGDLRHSLIGYVDEPHLSSPLGYGPSSADPETGEIIMANAFVYGAGMETLASFGRDIVALLNGDLDEADIRTGANVEAWAERLDAPGSEMTGRPADDHVIPLDGFDADDIDSAMDFSWARSFGSGSGASRPGSPAELLAQFDASLRNMHRNGAFGDGAAGSRAALSSLRGTRIEQEMTNDEMLIAAGIDPSLRTSADLSDEMLEAASPLRGMSPQALEAVERMRARVQAEACIVHADFADDGMLGLARQIQRAVTTGDGTMSWYGVTYDVGDGAGGIDYEEVRTMLRHPIFDAVTAHEIGHTLGLRHNFSGSFDSLNYHRNYWELRAADGDMQPRGWDPMSEAELDGRIREYQYSTVMDYGNNFVVTDSEGIGHYDHAAIKMGYGDMVEVFTNAADTREMAWVGFIQRAGWPVPLRLSAFTGGEVSAYPYTEIPELLGGIERIEQRADVPYTSLRAEDWLGSQGIDDPLVDAEGRVAVPYMFCSDEQADLNPDCQRYDAGADVYESLQSVIDTYWNYYIFNAFRRERLGFTTEAYAGRILTRYFRKLQHANQIYSLYRGVFEDIFGDSPSFDRFWTRPDGMGPWTVGVGASYQLLTQVVTAPEPGNYGLGTRPDGSRAYLTGGTGASVDELDGRFIETTWDFDAGYYWFDQLDRAGFYYDKILALQVLADPETHFLGRDTAADVRRYQISFYNSFAPSMTSFWRGLLGEDWRTIAPRATRTGVVWPTPLEMAGMDMAGDPLDPNASFSIQLYGAVYGMALIPETFDRTFADSARIFVRGGPESVTLDPATPVVELSARGQTYVAVSLPDASGRERGVAAQMLLHAQALRTAGATVEFDRFVDNIDLVRSLSWHLYYAP